MMLKRLLRRDTKGIGAVEFALIAPVLISFVIGISQMGKLFFANADMKNAIAHGARAASVWPVPESDDTIIVAVNERLARSGGLANAEVDVDRGTDGNGNDFIDIEMSYDVPLDFIFFDMGPITLNDTRRVYTQMAGNAPVNDNVNATSTSTTSTSSGDASTTTSSTSSGDASTSSTSSGDASTSSTSSGDASTSTTSASSTTSSSTTSSSSNGNGNSNGNSGHGHGDCKKKC